VTRERGEREATEGGARRGARKRRDDSRKKRSGSEGRGGRLGFLLSFDSGLCFWGFGF
jgi:hypothetical protein